MIMILKRSANNRLKKKSIIIYINPVMHNYIDFIVLDPTFNPIFDIYFYVLHVSLF